MRYWTWIVPAAALMGVAMPGRADTALSIYHGATARDAHILLGGWGSGSAKESTTEAYAGSGSILVTTEGYFAGGRIDFTNPIDFKDFDTQPNAALSLRIKFPGAGAGTVASAGARWIPGGGYFFPPMPGPPIPGGPMPGGPQPYGQATDDSPVQPPTHNLRIVLYSGKDRVAASDQPVDIEAADNGWVPVVVPLAAFKGPDGQAPHWANFQLSRMLIFGDASDSFNVGDIAVVNNNTPISDPSAGDDQTVAANEVVEFKGTATGNPGLHYSWDFDATDGIQEDAVGRSVTFKFRKPATYTVTLTVSDPTGLQKSVTATTHVEVTG